MRSLEPRVARPRGANDEQGARVRHTTAHESHTRSDEIAASIVMCARAGCARTRTRAQLTTHTNATRLTNSQLPRVGSYSPQYELHDTAHRCLPSRKWPHARGAGRRSHSFRRCSSDGGHLLFHRLYLLGRRAGRCQHGVAALEGALELLALRILLLDGA